MGNKGSRQRGGQEKKKKKIKQFPPRQYHGHLCQQPRSVSPRDWNSCHLARAVTSENSHELYKAASPTGLLLHNSVRPPNFDLKLVLTNFITFTVRIGTVHARMLQ